jgi:hypothetical protein
VGCGGGGGGGGVRERRRVSKERKIECGERERKDMMIL